MSSPRIPRIVKVRDYHDFEFLQEDLRQIIPSIKVKEIGHNPETGKYIGIAYLGALKDPKTRKVLRAEKKRLDLLEKNFDYNAGVPIRTG